MKKIVNIILIAFILFIPTKIYAISDNYKDNVSKYTNSKIEEDKINLYLFYGKECPHCEEERQWLKQIKEDYKNYLNINYYEVWHNEENAKIMDEISKEYEVDRKGVPLTIIGDKYFVGFSEVTKSKIENTIKEYSGLKNNPNEIKLPLIGTVNIKKVSIPLVAIILGFIDGINPCAMWILLFLINMLFGMKNRRKSWILGMTFLIVSGLVYFLSMLGINIVLSIASINMLKRVIAIVILIAGILNLRKYIIKRKKDTGCEIVDDKKRKKIVKQLKKIMNNKNFLLSLIGISLLAISVNLIELACSLGFPLIFTEILAINKVKGIVKILYLLIYIFFYMLDDIFVFTISMVTLEATGITNKYNKLATLISSIIMIIMGLLLIFKPAWLMLNF